MSADPAPGSCPEYGSTLAVNVWVTPTIPRNGDYVGGNVSTCVQLGHGPTPTCSQDPLRSNSSVSWDVGHDEFGPLSRYYVSESDHACNAAPFPVTVNMPIGGLPPGFWDASGAAVCVRDGRIYFNDCILLAVTPPKGPLLP